MSRFSKTAAVTQLETIAFRAGYELFERLQRAEPRPSSWTPLDATAVRAATAWNTGDIAGQKNDFKTFVEQQRLCSQEQSHM